jgi:SPASM domain peptide maturase of grasp-with-spasm system
MFSQAIISSCMDCGKVSQDYFTVSFAFFNEGTYRNTCLNGKIAIDQNGNVRNCLTSLKQYGNIKSHQLPSLLNDDFTRLWKLTKTDITKCKACEFRMMCPDCRVIAENSEDVYSPPLNCKYDPFTATWAL